MEPRYGICRECGARVPLVRDRWLHVHRVGSAEYSFPGASGRCPGSLMPVQEDPGRSDSPDGPAFSGS